MFLPLLEPLLRKNTDSFLTVYKQIVQERLKWHQSVGNAAVKQLFLPSRIIYILFTSFTAQKIASFYTQSENSKGKHIFDPGPWTSNKYHEAYALPQDIKEDRGLGTNPKAPHPLVVVRGGGSQHGMRAMPHTKCPTTTNDKP
jgi:hypothetical protein